MVDDSNTAHAERQRYLLDSYQRGNIGALVASLTSAQQRQFCRAIVEQAHNECVRVRGVAERRGDNCVAQATESARAWLEAEASPSDALQRRFDDFYNPFWLAFTNVSGDAYECATAAAYCTERTVLEADNGDWAAASREAVTVVDVVAQAAGADRDAARGQAERWQVEVAWALLHDSPPPSWPAKPPLEPSG